MAPTAVYESHLLKRSSSQANFDTPAAKKLNRGSPRHHKPTWDLQWSQRQDASFQDEQSIHSLLTRSIGLALETVGYEAAAPEAVESFSADVEEYMAHYLADVRVSMLSCRRTQATPQDFLQALHTHQLSLRSLLPHLHPPVPPSKSQFTLEKELSQPLVHHHSRFLGPALAGNPNERAKHFVPKHFPDLPSRHTYKATADFPHRESDPRKVRERATEEGRLGEEALRKLAGAGSDHPGLELRQRPEMHSMRARRDELWRETMQAATQDAPDRVDPNSAWQTTEREQQREAELVVIAFGNGRLGSVVNAERRYWRKPAVPRREANGIKHSSECEGHSRGITRR